MENDVLRKLQMTEYEMLKDVASFCDQNYIEYFFDCRYSFRSNQARRFYSLG